MTLDTTGLVNMHLHVSSLGMCLGFALCSLGMILLSDRMPRFPRFGQYPTQWESWRPWEG